MTTGEKLVLLSGLLTGTAMEHLLAITTGGTNPGNIPIVKIMGNNILGTVVQGAKIITIPEESINVRVDKIPNIELDNNLNVIIE